MMRVVPDPFETEEQHRRFNHVDLPDLTDTEILDELHALRPLLWWKLPGDDWLRERVKALQTELYKRKAGARNAIY